MAAPSEPASETAKRPYNNLLRRLSAADYSLVGPHLAPEEARANDLLYSPGDDVEIVHFPCGPSLASYLVPNEDGRDVETILVGREGAVCGIVSEGHLPAYTRIMVKFSGPFMRLHVGKLDAATQRISEDYLVASKLKILPIVKLDFFIFLCVVLFLVLTVAIGLVAGWMIGPAVALVATLVIGFVARKSIVGVARKQLTEVAGPLQNPGSGPLPEHQVGSQLGGDGRPAHPGPPVGRELGHFAQRGRYLVRRHAGQRRGDKGDHRESRPRHAGAPVRRTLPQRSQ